MFEGEDGVANEDGELSSGAFPNAPVWGRIATVFAGPFFNFILGFLIAFIMVNMIVIRDPVATEVLPDSAAAEAGLKDGDRIISINGEKVNLYEEISLYTAVYEYDMKPFTLEYSRKGEHISTALTPKYMPEYGRYMLGISNSDFVELKGFDNFKYSYYEMRYNFKMVYKSIGLLIRGRIGRKDVAGPVGIAVNVVGKTYEETKDLGWRNVLVNMLNILLMLTVNLGVLNLLPLPALDGGRLLFLLIEVVRGKPIPQEKEGMIHFAGLVFFLCLAVFVFFNDITNVMGL